MREGGQLAANVMRFARTLRAAGLHLGPGRVHDAVGAVAEVGVAQHERAARCRMPQCVHQREVRREDPIGRGRTAGHRSLPAAGRDAPLLEVDHQPRALGQQVVHLDVVHVEHLCELTVGEVPVTRLDGQQVGRREERLRGKVLDVDATRHPRVVQERAETPRGHEGKRCIAHAASMDDDGA